MNPRILITGANFGNKGAQSMLFTTVSEIRKRFPNAEIFFEHTDSESIKSLGFNFDEIFFNRGFIGVNNGVLITRKFRNSWGSVDDSIKIFPTLDLIVDVSGFSLGSKWGISSPIYYTNIIRIAKQFEIPVILMPQSFGPFDFREHQTEIDALIREFLSYPVKIFAREKDGYESLLKYGLKNVVWHPDLVLSSKNLDPSEIFTKTKIFYIPQVENKNSVGILPNMRSFDHGNPFQTFQIYFQLIEFLLDEGKEIYLFRHSFEDLEACTWLKSMFEDDSRVKIWNNDFSCFEYDEVCQQFEFLIVGRFHGVVHAYRNGIPCIILGWAVKYQELAEQIFQTKYIFDITKPDCDIEKIFDSIRDMENNLELNRRMILDRVGQIRKYSTCFEVMNDTIEKSMKRKLSA